jgi:inner membrane protein
VLGRTHVVIGCVTWTAAWWRPIEGGPLAPVVTTGDAPRVLVTLAVVALGTLLPDLDHPGAWLAQLRLGRRGGVLHWVRPLLIPSLALREEFGHRGALHSLAAALVFCLGLEVLGGQRGVSNAGYALAWGYVLHLLADMATRRGVPLFYPFSRTRVGLPAPLAVRTGSLGESIYLAVVSGASALYAAIDQVRPPA